MLNVLRGLGAVGLTMVLLVGLLPVPVVASIGACSASVSPSSLTPGSDETLDVRVTNITGPSMIWIQVVRPNAAYTINTAEASGWQADVSTGSVVFTGGLINGDGSVTLHLGVHAVAWQSQPANWTIRASDSPYGAGATDCSGARSTTIQVYMAPENAGEGIADVVAEPTATAVVIRWTSSVPTGSGVSYGTTSDYGGSTAYDSTLTTQHTVSISGLSPETAYHFQVAGLDEGNAPYYSGDSTFLTGVLPVGTGGGSGTGGAGPTSTPTVTPGVYPPEAVPPTVALTITLAAVYKDPPTLTGVAADNVVVAKVEYSLDGGKTWLAVDEMTPRPVRKTVGRGKQRRTVTTTDNAAVSFRFRPVIIEDGNYDVLVRATDASGNQAMTPSTTMVIDRLPPRLGGVLAVSGAQVVTPDVAGRWPAVVAVDQRLTLRAVGGPVSMMVAATKTGADRASQHFALRYDRQTGLWDGVMSFEAAGLYHLAAEAVDGAGNQTSSQLPDVAVSPAARLMGADNRPVMRAQVTLYYRQPETGEWVVWDGGGLGQANPQTVKAMGTFRYLAPAGTYYLRVEAPGYQSLVTRQFTLTRTTPLVPTLRLKSQPRLGVGAWSVPLPWVTLTRVDIRLAQDEVKTTASGLVGRSWPNVSLPLLTSAGTGKTLTRVDLLGKPTVVTVLAGWAPMTNEQLPSLADLQHRHDVNVVPLVLGERGSRVQAFLSRAGSEAAVAVDSDAGLSRELGVANVPTHYLLDRNGVIRKVWSGVVSSAELTKAMMSL